MSRTRTVVSDDFLAWADSLGAPEGGVLACETWSHVEPRGDASIVKLRVDLAREWERAARLAHVRSEMGHALQMAGLDWALAVEALLRWSREP